MSGSNEKRFKREQAGVVTLADLPVNPAHKPSPACPMLRLDQITPVQEKALRESAANVKAVLGCALKVLYNGQFHTIKLQDEVANG